MTMKVTKTRSGCEALICPTARYPAAGLAHTSPIVRDGLPCLWVGDHHFLDRSQVAELVNRLQQWLVTGSLALPEEATAESA